MKAIYIITIFLISGSMSGQSFKEDMRRVRESYENNYISMQVNYKMYNSETDVKPEETQSMWMESFGNKLHYRGQGEELIYTDKNLLMVSTNDKEIVLDTVLPNFNQPNNNQLIPLDTAVAKMKTISFKDLGDDLIQYTLVPSKPDEVGKIIYVVNKNTWLLERIELFSGPLMDGGKVVITYSQMIKREQAPLNSFSFNPFISAKPGGGYIITSTYKDYKFYHRNNYRK